MFGFCSAARCDRSLWENSIWFEHDVAAVTQRKDCTNQSKRLHATATFTFEQFLHDFVSLDWHRIHSSEKEQQQHPKSWVQCFGALFLAVSGTLLFASCQNGTTQHHPAGLSMLGLVVWQRAWLATWSKGTDIRVLPCSSNMSGFGMVFGWHMFLILWEEAPQECFLLGTRRGLHLSNAVMDDSCCSAALLVISLFGIGLLQQDKIVTGDVRPVIKHGKPDKYWWEQL